MDDSIFEYATDDVVAGSRRFPQRPVGHPLHAGLVEPTRLATTGLRGARADESAAHAWDASGHL